MEVLAPRGASSSGFIADVHAGTFPNLREIEVSPEERYLDRLLRAHGGNIRTIHLHNSPQGLVLAWFEALVRYCPNLQEIKWSWFFDDVVGIPYLEEIGVKTFPNIRVLGIEMCTPQLTKGGVKSMSEAICSWLGRKEMPDLRTVHFFSEATVSHLWQKHAPRLEKLLKACAEAGVQVEDSCPLDAPLCIPSTSTFHSDQNQGN